MNRPSVRDLVTSFSELNNPFLDEETVFKSPSPPVPARSSRRLSPSPPPLGPRPSQMTLQRSDSAPITPSSPQRRAMSENLQPDISQVSRTPPIARRLLNTAIHTKSLIKCFSTTHNTICTSTGQFNLKFWTVGRTDCVKKVNFDERAKITALCFVPSHYGEYLWVGFQTGELISVNVTSGSTAERKTIHQGPITAIHRTNHGIYTLDSLGGLRIWKASESGEYSLLGNCDAFRLRDQFIHSKIAGSFLILAHQKWIEVFSLSQGRVGDFLKRFDVGLNIASLSCLAITDDGNLLFSGHDDGKVLVWNLVSMDLQTVFPLSVYRITSMVMNNKFLWIGYSTGKIQVVDYNRESWLIRNDFQSFTAAAVTLLESDMSGMVESGLNLVVSVSDAGIIKLWDGNMMQDWIETEIWKRQREYSDFFDWNIMIYTWNVNSSKPSDDPSGLDAFLNSSNTVPEIIVLGVQEIVNLESGAVNARQFLKMPLKGGLASSDGKGRAWQDHLLVQVRRAYPGYSFRVVSSQELMGLFICVLVNNNVSDLVKEVSASTIKTGLGGLHANKGGLAVRMIVQDSSLCFVNVHLAAHQREVLARNNNLTTIFREASFPALDVPGAFLDASDGSNLLDHENIFLFGDTNYRLDISRKEALKLIESQAYHRLLEHDQLIRELHYNRTFILKGFKEAEIRFAPTYKYDVGKETYDSSEKARVPAYCDRILFNGRVQVDHYQPYQNRVSDHWAVGGRFKVQLKRIDSNRRMECATKVAKEADRRETLIQEHYALQRGNTPTRQTFRY